MSGTPGGGLAKRLALALVSALLTLAALEVLARVYVTRVADRDAFSRYASIEQYRERTGAEQWWFGLLAPHRYLGYVGVPDFVDGANRHDSRGFRGEEAPVPKPAGEFRIVCLGASTTYGVLVDDYRESYPYRLQVELRERGFPQLRVVNAGVPAWSSYETLINYLLRVQELEPDLIVVHQAFGDVITRLVWPPEAYRGDNSGYFAPLVAREAPPWYARSALLRILLVETGRMLPPAAFDKGVYNQADTSYYLEFVRQNFRGSYPSGIFREVPIARMLESNPPTHFRRNTEALVRAAQAGGVQPVLMTFVYSPEVGAGYFDVPGFRSATDAHNEILRELGRRLDVPVMDLAAVFPTEKAWWGYDGIHVNARGAALKARLLAEFLVERGLVPRPAG